MRKILYSYTIIVLYIFFNGIFLGCSNQTPVPIAQDIEKQKEEIKSILTDMWDAIEKEDIERYATYIHPEFSQFGEYDSVLRVGKENEVNGIAGWIKESSNIHTEMEKPLVTINGDVAWIVYYWSDSGITNGKEFATKGKSTRIFVKEQGKWLCIHGHYTLLSSN